MKLIIDMPEEDYEFTKGAKTARYFSSEYYVNLILNGTPLEHGEWIVQNDLIGHKQKYVCDKCKSKFSYDAETGKRMLDYNFCPNCGTDMRGE